jgi:hypothetical protein
MWASSPSAPPVALPKTPGLKGWCKHEFINKIAQWSRGKPHRPGTTFAGSAHTWLCGRSLMRVEACEPPVRFVKLINEHKSVRLVWVCTVLTPITM